MSIQGGLVSRRRNPPPRKSGGIRFAIPPYGPGKASQEELLSRAVKWGSEEELGSESILSSGPHPTAAGCFGAGCSEASNRVISARLIAACRVAAVILAPRRSVT